MQLDHPISCIARDQLSGLDLLRRNTLWDSLMESDVEFAGEFILQDGAAFGRNTCVLVCWQTITNLNALLLYIADDGPSMEKLNSDENWCVQ